MIHSAFICPSTQAAYPAPIHRRLGHPSRAFVNTAITVAPTEIGEELDTFEVSDAWLNVDVAFFDTPSADKMKPNSMAKSQFPAHEHFSSSSNLDTDEKVDFAASCAARQAAIDTPSSPRSQPPNAAKCPHHTTRTHNA
ncbi:unnamed protein product [Peniophora sp. CBMAI 1063]|nr:unnamed protein product [Peniophora sp. CBMAI 1063]